MDLITFITSLSLSTPISILLIIFLFFVVVYYIIPKVKRNEELEKIVDDYIKDVSVNVINEIKTKIEKIAENLDDLNKKELEEILIKITYIENSVDNIKLIFKSISEMIEDLLMKVKIEEIDSNTKRKLERELESMREKLQELEMKTRKIMKY